MDAVIDLRDFWIVPTRTFPLFDPLRSEPRFDALFRKMILASSSDTTDGGAAAVVEPS